MSVDHSKRAKAAISEILNLALNLHIHKLSDAGYLKKRKHSKDCGFKSGEELPALKLKYDLIEEVCNRLEPAICDYLEHPRNDLWPVHDKEKVESKIQKLYKNET